MAVFMNNLYAGVQTKLHSGPKNYIKKYINKNCSLSFQVMFAEQEEAQK